MIHVLIMKVAFSDGYKPLKGNAFEWAKIMLIEDEFKEMLNNVSTLTSSIHT